MAIPNTASNQLAIIKKDTADLVAAKVHQLQQNGELALPKNYATANALKSAWLMLQTVETTDKQPVLMACTKDSIYNAMLDMVVQGLNPAKKQCYFIAYGKALGCQRSYFGDEELVRQIRPDVDVYYQVIYEGDEFEYGIERGKTRIAKHVQKFGNINTAKIQGAYCVIEADDGRIVNSVIMTIAQIHQSWKKSKMYKADGITGFHHEQPDQACLRTVIRRCCKPVINTSSDGWLLQAVQREDAIETEGEMEAEIAGNANGDFIDIELPEHDAETGEVIQDEPEAPAPAPGPARPAGPSAGRGPTPASRPAPARPAAPAAPEDPYAD